MSGPASVWHQTTPDGTLAVVLMEADDIDATIDPRLDREQIKDVHGVDLASDPPPKVEFISDMRF